MRSPSNWTTDWLTELIWFVYERAVRRRHWPGRSTRSTHESVDFAQRFIVHVKSVCLKHAFGDAKKSSQLNSAININKNYPELRRPLTKGLLNSFHGSSQLKWLVLLQSNSYTFVLISSGSLGNPSLSCWARLFYLGIPVSSFWSVVARSGILVFRVGLVCFVRGFL